MNPLKFWYIGLGGLVIPALVTAADVHPARDVVASELQQSPFDGIDVAIGAMGIYQRNIRGGRSTNDRSGEFSGSYDLEMIFDLQRLTGFDGIIFIHAEGGWTGSEGIGPESVGSAFGVNADAIGSRSLDIVEFFYERPLSDRWTLTIGKIDLTGFFDTSAYANDEVSQFLNGALVNNPAVPFPDYSLGAVLTYDLADNWYVMGGVADARADGRETGFNTAFHGSDDFFYILETGAATAIRSANGDLLGNYRFGVWYDPRPKANTDLAEAGKSYRDDTGLYISCDQMLTKENPDSQNTQGLGAFFRYGYAHSRANDVTNVISAGFQYQGLFDGRDDDVLGLGFAHGTFSDSADDTYSQDYENVTELYYSAQVTPWMNLSPSVQYVANPGGGGDAEDAVILGVRALVVF